MPAPTVIKLKQCTMVKESSIVSEKKGTGILTYASSDVRHRSREISHQYWQDKVLHRIVGRSGGVVEKVFWALDRIDFRALADQIVCVWR